MQQQKQDGHNTTLNDASRVALVLVDLFAVAANKVEK
jgi:uncharacterized membrane protein